MDQTHHTELQVIQWYISYNLGNEVVHNCTSPGVGIILWMMFKTGWKPCEFGLTLRFGCHNRGLVTVVFVRVSLCFVLLRTCDVLTMVEYPT